MCDGFCYSSVLIRVDVGWCCALTHCEFDANSCGSWFWGNYDATSDNLTGSMVFDWELRNSPPLLSLWKIIYPNLWNYMECPVFCDTENSNLVRYNHTLKLQNMIPRAVCDGYFMIFPCRHRGLPPLCPSHCRCSALYATWAEVRLSSVAAGYHPCSILGWNWVGIFGNIWLIGKVVVVATVVISFDSWRM